MNILINRLYNPDDTLKTNTRVMSVQDAFAITDDSILCRTNDNAVIVIAKIERYGSTRGVLKQLAEKNFFEFNNNPAIIIKTKFPLNENGLAYRNIQMFLSRYDGSLRGKDWKDIDVPTNY